MNITLSPTTTSTSTRRRDKRRSFWQRSFDQARLAGDWYRIPKLYTRKSASQIASDIRRSHLRRTKNQRVRGFRSAEVWEAKWQPTTLGAPGVGSSRVDLQACKLEYSIVSPK